MGTAFPRTFTEFILFRIIGGLGIGAASMTLPMYIAEIAPARMRGRMVSVNQLAIVTGISVVYFVNYFIAQYGAAADRAAGAAADTWNVLYGWRWMFGSGILPSTVFLSLLLFVPESPRWLVKRGRPGDALAVLAKVGGGKHASDEMREIQAALEPGNRLAQPALRAGHAHCAVDRRQPGRAATGHGHQRVSVFRAEILKKLGSETDVALLQTVLVGGVNLGFTVVAIWTVDRLGRKPLMLVGSVGMGLCLLGMGLAAYCQRTEAWTLALILGYIACFALSVGPVTWVVLSEIFPTGIRGRAMALATVCLWVANYVVTQTFTYMDESPWLVERFHHGFPFWVYAAFCAVSVIVVWRFVPETKGKTLEQIEQSWFRHKKQ